MEVVAKEGRVRIYIRVRPPPTAVAALKRQIVRQKRAKVVDFAALDEAKVLRV